MKGVVLIYTFNSDFECDKISGVVPEETLKTRFIQVATLARRLDLVPTEGAPLLVHLLSYLQSLLLFKTSMKTPDIGDNKVEQLDSNELLCRAEFWLNRGDLMQTLKYMNCLKGASRYLNDCCFRLL